ncbi:MAG: TIM barrel protein [Promethearchaeota archaeon]
MPFLNDKIRIGPTGVLKERFLMIGRGEKLRKGKRFEIPEYLSNLGLNAYEFSAGRMANFSDSPIYNKFRANSEKYDVAISIHAPYYISFTSENPETYEKSIERLANTYAWAVWLNAKRIVLHPGSYGKNNEKRDLIRLIVNGINRSIELSEDLFPGLKKKFKNVCLCPETMGKLGQLGSTDEIIEICKQVGTEKARPCIDFGHMYARNRGKVVGDRLYKPIFEKIENELGKEIVENLHIHYSKVEFSQKGEKMHHTNDSSWGPDIESLFKIVRDQGFKPIIINESPDLELDAKKLMDLWIKMK